MNAWTFLFIAGVCEIGWPLGFKLANDFLNLRWGFIAFSVVSMILSGFFCFWLSVIFRSVRLMPYGRE